MMLAYLHAARCSCNSSGKMTHGVLSTRFRDPISVDAARIYNVMLQVTLSEMRHVVRDIR